jgi:hypothetical protein
MKVLRENGLTIVLIVERAESRDPDGGAEQGGNPDVHAGNADAPLPVRFGGLNKSGPRRGHRARCSGPPSLESAGGQS